MLRQFRIVEFEVQKLPSEKDLFVKTTEEMQQNAAREVSGGSNMLEEGIYSSEP